MDCVLCCVNRTHADCFQVPVLPCRKRGNENCCTWQYRVIFVGILCIWTERTSGSCLETFLIDASDYRVVSASYLGRDSSVGIASRHGMDGSGIESRWRRDFPHPSRPTLESNPVSYKMGTHPPPSIVEVKERVELYIHSTSGPSWPLLGWNFISPHKFLPEST